MSKKQIKTVDELIDKLDNELAWRKKEIIQANLLISSNVENTPLSFTQKSSILIIYANWEGFINKAANYYAMFVFSQNIPLIFLKTGFLEIKLQQKRYFDDLMISKKQVVRKRFLDNLNKELYSKDIPRFEDTLGKRYISTDSNLSSKLFENILELLGIDSSRFLTRANFIDSVLLSYRNSLAHGERGYEIVLEDFDEVAHYILKLMDTFKDSLIDSAIRKDYIRKLDKSHETNFI
ncbi:MAE_28990/MAE_18760 family HEPN-like nuclease [Limosilactobacillus caviae]|uniref:MAE_28990/MAE_18760 family HEPN-like nuclease n=1 Tax=Limosilactobacillus caviae TaxID=1769424 RepID=UPI00129ADA79|nr:hypothetical protein [Limosilactobacillus reuteri]